MKKYLLASVAALGIIAAGAASAADLPSRKGPVAAPVYIPPVFTWTGFYVGANAGYGWGNVNANGFANVGDLDGFVGGGQIGYNYQMGQFVLGLEADLQGADLSSGNNLGLVRVKTDYFGTVRARVGFAIDRFMPYVTGGWAYGNVKTSIPALAFSNDSSHTGGWTVGGGIPRRARTRGRVDHGATVSAAGLPTGAGASAAHPATGARRLPRPGPARRRAPPPGGATARARTTAHRDGAERRCCGRRPGGDRHRPARRS